MGLSDPVAGGPVSAIMRGRCALLNTILGLSTTVLEGSDNFAYSSAYSPAPCFRPQSPGA